MPDISSQFIDIRCHWESSCAWEFSIDIGGLSRIYNHSKYARWKDEDVIALKKEIFTVLVRVFPTLELKDDIYSCLFRLPFKDCIILLTKLVGIKDNDAFSIDQGKNSLARIKFHNVII